MSPVAIGVKMHNDAELYPAKDRQYLVLSSSLISRIFQTLAVTDRMKSLANSIGKWAPWRFDVLGTDGVGSGEARAQIRD